MYKIAINTGEVTRVADDVEWSNQGNIPTEYFYVDLDELKEGV